MPMVWIYTQMHSDDRAVVPTTKTSGFTTHQHPSKTSIQWQELFAVIAATLTWDHQWSIWFFCDNLPIVQAWEGKTSCQPCIMSLLCLLFFTATKGNFTITLKHIPDVKNPIACHLKAQLPIVFLFRLTGPLDPYPNPWNDQSGFHRFTTFCSHYNVLPLPATKLTVTYMYFTK